MEVPLRDTPALTLLDRGFGRPDTEPRDVADCMQLLRFSKRLLSYFYDHFTAREISPGKYSVLCELLAAKGALPPSTLAERIGVSRPTITGLLDGLCRQKLVERIADPADRRRMSVALTRHGRRFLADLLPAQYALMAEVVSSLTDGDRRHLRRILDTLEGDLE